MPHLALLLAVASFASLCLPAQVVPAQTPCVSTVTGALDIIPLTSKVFGNERKLRVWLPPGYRDAAHANTTYSVLYLFDGAGLFDMCTSPLRQGEWQVDEILTDLIEQHKVEPIIVVGIDSTAHRGEELTPYGNPLFFGDAKAFLGARVPEFLTDEVQPLIASRYRVKKGREHTGVGGASLGGVAALTTLLKRPDVFGLGLLESTSMQVGNGQLLRDTEPVVMGPVRVSVGVGTMELGEDATMLGVPDFDAAFVALNQRMAANLKAAMANHPKVLVTVQQGGRHSAGAWGHRFEEAIQFLYPPKPVEESVDVRRKLP